MLALLNVGCTRTPPCWERGSLQAAVTVRGDDLTLTGRLTFARPTAAGTGTLQFDVEREGHLDNVTLLATGAATAFTDGVPRALRAHEQRTLDVLAATFGWPGRDAVRTAVGGTGAMVVMPDGARYTIEVGPEATPAHHLGR